MRKQCFSPRHLLRTGRPCQNLYESRHRPTRDNSSSLVACPVLVSLGTCHEFWNALMDVEVPLYLPNCRLVGNFLFCFSSSDFGGFYFVLFFTFHSWRIFSLVSNSGLTVFFFFCTLKMLWHFLLAPMISEKKSTIVQINISLCSNMLLFKVFLFLLFIEV